MRLSSLVATAAIFLDVTLPQTTTYFEPGLPTDAPLPGHYDGPYRPQVHYSPPVNFMNDPNGMHRGADGVWHLHYQYNPVEPVPGDENQKIAPWLFNKTTQVLSGSAVTDPDNTSGFFPNQNNGVVAFYTIAVNDGLQTQKLAVSYDDGYRYETYINNPIINIGSTQFRDPQVTWHEATKSWIMALARSAEYKAEFYTSTNLRHWTAVSNSTHHGLTGGQYECPNLVHNMPVVGSADTMDLLYISINPGAPLGGSIGQYFAGKFNGTHFIPVDDGTRIAGFGKDNYAAQFFSGVPNVEPPVSIAWASNWQYTSVVPTGQTEGWRSQMSLPRNNYLKKLPTIGYFLVSEPYDIQSIFLEELAHRPHLGNGSVIVDYSSVASGALYFEANVTGLSLDTLAGTMNFTFTSSESGEYLKAGTFVGTDVWLDRGHTRGFDNQFFADKFSARGVYGDEGLWRISGVIDRTIIEIFVNGGEQSATSIFYPSQPLDTLRIAASGIRGDAKVAVGVWALVDAWAMQANSNGTVVGNVTTLSV